MSKQTTTHACPDCGQAHLPRVKTPEERIAELEQRLADLEAERASAETARELDRITHHCGCVHYYPPVVVPCTRPHYPYTIWSSTGLTSGTVTYGTTVSDNVSYSQS